MDGWGEVNAVKGAWKICYRNKREKNIWKWEGKAENNQSPKQERQSLEITSGPLLIYTIPPLRI